MKVWKRRLPHVELEGAVYYMTFRIAKGIFLPEERIIVLDHIQSGDPKFFELFAVVVMPDHVHIILRPNKGIDLQRLVKGIKGVSARK